MNCIHGHGIDCVCGGCKIARCGRQKVIVLPEPQRRALIACQIQKGLAMTWTSRTYEVTLAADGQWLVDFGEGPFESRRDWAGVLDWLTSLRPTSSRRRVDGGVMTNVQRMLYTLGFARFKRYRRWVGGRWAERSLEPTRRGVRWEHDPGARFDDRTHAIEQWSIVVPTARAKLLK